MVTRLTKILLVWAIAFFATLVVFNNLTDHELQLPLVAHVLAMDTTFPGNSGMWRAIDSPALQPRHVWADYRNRGGGSRCFAGLVGFVCSGRSGTQSASLRSRGWRSLA